MAIKEYFPFLFPFLLVTWLVFQAGLFLKIVKPTNQFHKIIVLIMSAVVTFFPFTGLSLAKYLLSLNPNFSIGSLALFGILLGEQLGGKPLLSRKHLWEFCVWNVAVSLALFLSSLGFVAYDMYAQGYHFSIWFLIVALLTIILIWRDHPLTYIFVAYIAAFNLKMLPSHNFFDYLIDGFLFTISLSLLLYFTISSARSGAPACDA